MNRSSKSEVFDLLGSRLRVPWQSAGRDVEHSDRAAFAIFMGRARTGNPRAEAREIGLRELATSRLMQAI